MDTPAFRAQGVDARRPEPALRNVMGRAAARVGGR
jgi:hypothetical protein